MGVAAITYINQVETQGGRFLLGFPDVDKMTRGHGDGELTLITGRAHSGKTQVVLNAFNNNTHKNILLFTPDETAEAVLAKLVAIRNGISCAVLEDGVKAGDEDIVRLVRRTAAHDFKNLVVIDDHLNYKEMSYALSEAEDMWQGDVGLVVYDYAELMQNGEGGYESVIGVMRQFKKWAKIANAPFICLHQGKKSESTRGQAAGMDGMRYGGDSEAIMVLEVFRKREDPSNIGHENTITINVAKNKRPPMRKGMVDMFMNPDTGHIRSLTKEDLVRAGAPTQDPMVAYRATRETS